ncbi:MAG: prephenate dehydrogenase/arogenate dehydrogenase family protein [Selenomonadaceae bacterium]|nr:prephenate dehydrogenase/arogenate dehydrogenase family protein [Selenomonadaceae bacterium]
MNEKILLPKTLAIIGVGLIGGSLGLCLKKKLGDKIFITGLCRTENSMKTAVDLGAVDFASSDIEKVVGNAEIIFLSPPVLQIVPMVKKILPYLKPGTILTDAGSTKKFIAEELKKILPKDIFYIGGHPMTGKEKSGVTAASADLFKNKVYVIIDDANIPADVYEKFMNLLQLTEANFTPLDIERHDRCASIISHVPHITAAALVNLLNQAGGDLYFCLKLIGGGFKDTTRIASSNADMWADICMTNSEAISNHLRELQDILGEVIQAVDNHDRQFIYDYFSRSKKRRDEILEKFEKKFNPN